MHRWIGLKNWANCYELLACPLSIIKVDAHRPNIFKGILGYWYDLNLDNLVKAGSLPCSHILSFTVLSHWRKLLHIWTIPWFIWKNSCFLKSFKIGIRFGCAEILHFQYLNCSIRDFNFADFRTVPLIFEFNFFSTENVTWVRWNLG